MIYQARQAYAMGKKLRYKPFEPILLACNEAIQACQTRNPLNASHAISYLYEMLDFRHAPEQSAELASLYDYCELLVSHREFDKALRVLGQLRDTWLRIIRLSGGLNSQWSY